MQEKAVFHLFIPSLIQKLNSWFKDFSFDAITPHLSSLLLNCDKHSLKGIHGFENSLFKYLDPKINELPVAYYRYQIHNKNIHKNLMCADPVHLEAGLNDVTLTKKIIDLSDAEASELIQILNNHFNDDGLEFILGTNQCWYVTFNQNEMIQSYDIDSMLMKNVIGKQATSQQRKWEAIQNEAQMLLHSSDINQQREMAGLETVNSLWFWGAGAPIDNKLDIQCVYYPKESSSTIRSEYFAKAANADLMEIPDDLIQLLNDVDKNHSTQVFILDQLLKPASEDNVEEFQKQLTKIDNEIVEPLHQAWKNNNINIEINCCNGTILKPQQASFFTFWQKPKKLREIVDETGS